MLHLHKRLSCEVYCIRVHIYILKYEYHFVVIFKEIFKTKSSSFDTCQPQLFFKTSTHRNVTYYGFTAFF